MKFVSLKGSETRHDKFLGNVKEEDEEDEEGQEDQEEQEEGREEQDNDEEDLYRKLIEDEFSDSDVE